MASLDGCDPPRSGLVRAEAHATGRAQSAGLAEGSLEARRTGSATRSGSRASAGHFAGHMIVYRHADPRFPFLWESADQPPGRWHARDEGPVQYLADTPDGAWAEFLRHEGITEESELANVRRALWAVEVPDDLPADAPRLAQPVLTGGLATYEECQNEARRLRSKGTKALRAPSAALLAGDARGWKVDGGLHPGTDRDGSVLAVFGRRPDFVGWVAALAARPRSDLLARVRRL
jgi:hypothetical protein